MKVQVKWGNSAASVEIEEQAAACLAAEIGYKSPKCEWINGRMDCSGYRVSLSERMVKALGLSYEVAEFEMADAIAARDAMIAEDEASNARQAAYAEKAAKRPFVCHYCGQPAIGFGPFGEPACEQCGGSHH